MVYTRLFKSIESEEEGYAYFSGIVMGIIHKQDTDETTKMQHINQCSKAFQERFPQEFYANA
jgi:hypothetical protein